MPYVHALWPDTLKTTEALLVCCTVLVSYCLWFDNLVATVGEMEGIL